MLKSREMFVGQKAGKPVSDVHKSGLLLTCGLYLESILWRLCCDERRQALSDSEQLHLLTTVFEPKQPSFSNPKQRVEGRVKKPAGK